VQGAVVAAEDVREGKAGRPGLQRERPAVVVGLQDGHRLGTARADERVPEAGDLLAHAGDLVVAAAGAAVGVQDAVPEGLGAGTGRAPAKVDDGVRAVGDGLVGPQAELPGSRRAAHRLPAARSRLLLDHPEGLILEAADRIVREGYRHGIQGAERGIVVPGAQVERPRHPVIVDGVKREAHVVGGDAAVPIHGAQGIDLELLVSDHLVRGEAVKVEFQAGVGDARGLPRQGHLGPVGVGVAPEGRAPGIVQDCEKVVALARPGGKGVPALGAIAARGIVATELVIHLPGHDVRMPGEMRGHGGDDALRVGAVGGAGGAVLAAHAEGHPAPVPGDAQDVGVGLTEPGRGRGRRGAEHGVDALGGEGVDGLVEPTEVERTLGGLHLCPGELTQAREVDAGLAHQAGVRRPAFARPLLRVIVDAIIHGPPLPRRRCLAGAAARRVRTVYRV